MRFKIDWKVFFVFLILAFVLHLLFNSSCTSSKMWTRPNPHQPSMPYDTLAYKAKQGDPVAWEQLIERRRQETQKAKTDSILREWYKYYYQLDPLEERLRRIEWLLDEIQREQFREFWRE